MTIQNNNDVHAIYVLGGAGIFLVGYTKIRGNFSYVYIYESAVYVFTVPYRQI